jgi:hypothetical protein
MQQLTSLSPHGQHRLLLESIAADVMTVLVEVLQLVAAEVEHCLWVKTAAASAQRAVWASYTLLLLQL